MIINDYFLSLLLLYTFFFINCNIYFKKVYSIIIQQRMTLTFAELLHNVIVIFYFVLLQIQKFYPRPTSIYHFVSRGYFYPLFLCFNFFFSHFLFFPIPICITVRIRRTLLRYGPHIHFNQIEHSHYQHTAYKSGYQKHALTAVHKIQNSRFAGCYRYDIGCHMHQNGCFYRTISLINIA